MPHRRNINETREFIDLVEILDFTGFRWTGGYYVEDEITILAPQLQAKGYSVVKWEMGEADSFGPLTRVCELLDPEGKTAWGIYG